MFNVGRGKRAFRLGERSAENDMNATVVLADSVATYRRLVAECLKNQGFEVREAQNGVELTNAVETTGANIVIIDNTLDGRSGLELIPKLSAFSPASRFILVVEPTFKVDSCEEFCQKNKLARIVRGPAHPEILASIVSELARETKTEPPKRISEGNTKYLGASRYELDDAAEDHLLAVRRS